MIYLCIKYSGNYKLEKISSYIKSIKINYFNTDGYIIPFNGEIVNGEIICGINKEFFLIDESISPASIEMILLLNGDIIEIHLENELHYNFFDKKEDYFINIYPRLNKQEALYVDIQKKDRMKMKVAEIYSGKNYTKFILELMDNPVLNYCKEILGIHLENSVTNETIMLEPIEVFFDENRMLLSCDFSEKITYEGPWNISLILEVKSEKIKIDMSMKCDKSIYTEFTSFNKKAFFHKIFQNDNEQLQINPVEYPYDILSNDLNDIVLHNNKMEIVFTSHFHTMFSIKDRPISMILRKRTNHNDIKFPVIDLDKDVYIVNIDNSKVSVLFEDGIWDILLEILVNDEIVELPLVLREYASNLVTLPEIIYNNHEIKSARFYSTLDNSLALLIKNEFYSADVDFINIDDERIQIKGWLDLKTQNIQLQNMSLMEKETKELMDISFESNFYKGCYHFNINIFSKQYNIINDYYQKKFVLTANVAFGESSLTLPISFNYGEKEKYKSRVYPPFYLKEPYLLQPQFDIDNTLNLNFKHAIKTSCTKIQKTAKEIVLYIQLNEANIVSEKTVLVFVNNKKEIEHEIGVSSILNNNLVFRIDKKTFNKTTFIDKQWELFIRCSSYDGNEFLSNVSVQAEKRRLFPTTFKAGSVKVKRKKYFSVFSNVNNNINLEVREIKAYESVLEKNKFTFAKLLAKLLKPFFKKPIWFIGENLAEVAQDNGIAFFKYCFNNHKDHRYYYISVKENKNGEVLEPYKKNVILYDSFKHYLFYHLSENLIVSHGLRDVIPTYLHNKMRFNKKPVIYLQHGIVAMKKLKFNRKSYNGMIKKFVVSSEFEKKIFVEQMNFLPEQICVTGLSRFDTLEDKSTSKKKKEIVIMPTWREWIKEEEFETSLFYKNYVELLKSEKLNKLLKDYNVKIKFFMHIELQRKFSHYFQGFESDIEVINVGDQTVNEILSESSLLITDYSSVVFDFHYMNKPILFYQFDLDDYLNYRGSYINMKTDLFGPTASTSEELISFIQENLERNFKAEDRYKIKSRKYYKYFDRNNSERIFKEILSIKNV